MIIIVYGVVFDILIQVVVNGELIGELVESWEVILDVKIWMFKLCKGVIFYNGKVFGVDDVMVFFNMYVVEGVKFVVKLIVLVIIEMNKISDYELFLIFVVGNVDFLFLLFDYYICIFLVGQIEEVIVQGIGIGFYKVESFDSGVCIVLSCVDGYYKDGKEGWFDFVEIIVINDVFVCMNVLMIGQVDVVNCVDFKIEVLFKVNLMINIFEVIGNQYFIFLMLIGLLLFDNVKVCKVLKYVINCQEMVDKIFLGYGVVVNDILIGLVNQYYVVDLLLNDYDLDLVKFLLKEVGLDGLFVDLFVFDVVFFGVVDVVQLY